MPVLRFKSPHLLPKPMPVMSVIQGTMQQLDHRPVVKISQPVQQPRQQALSCEVPAPKLWTNQKRFSVVVKAGQGQVQSTSSISMDKLARKKEVVLVGDQAGVVGPGSMSGKKRPSQKSFNEPDEPPAKKPNYSNQQPPPQRQHFSSQQPQQHYSRGEPSQPQTHHHRAQNNYTQHQPHQQQHQHQHQQQHHHASHPRQQTPVPEFNGQCHSNFRSIPLVDSTSPPAHARPPPNTATERIGLPVTSVNWNWNGSSSSDQNDAKNKLDGCGALESDMRCFIKKAVEVSWLKNPDTSVKECRQFIEQNIENQKYDIAKVSKNSLRCQVHRTLNNLKTHGSIHKKRPGPRVKYGISVKNNILQLALNKKQQR